MKRAASVLVIFIILVMTSCRISPETHEHDFNCGTVTAHVEPTCLIDGFESVRCKYCEVEHITEIPSIRHHTKDGGSVVWVEGHEVTTYRCAVCGEYIETVVEHHISEDWTSDAFNHWHGYTCGCTAHADEAPHFFEETSVIYGNGCERARVITKTCSICGYTTSNALPVIAHVPGTPSEEGGLKVTRCTVCGKVLSVE